MAASTTAVLQRVLADHADVAGVLADLHQAAWDTTDPVLLELCGSRAATLLGWADDTTVTRTAIDPAKRAALAQWPTSPLFDERERAVLDLTEQFVIDVASLDDRQVGRAVAALGAQGYVDFVNALLVIEQRMRMSVAWGRLFPEVVA